VLRSLKYGIFGAILAGLIAAPIAWATVDKSVTLVVDGRAQTVHTTAADVGQLLASRGYHVDVHDLVAPATAAALHDGMRVVLRRGRLLHLDINGMRRDVWTTAPTVAAALAQLGYPTSAFVSVSRSQRLPLTPSSLVIRTPRAVTIIDHGQQQQVTTTDATVGALLADLGVNLGRHDEVSPGVGTALSNGAVIRIQQVVRKTIVRRETIGFPTRRHDDPSVLRGQTRVLQAGRKGILKVTYSVIYLNGKEVGRDKIGSTVVRPPRAQILAIGTKQPAPRQLTARHHRTHQGGAPNAGIPSPGSAKAIARQMVAARGWGQDQYNCLVVLWDHESGWRVNAYNPSGAYGIPQALPGSKMASAGPDWRTNPSTQIRWGLNYISSRYGTPCNAWAQWQANGGWY
jgi:uncharacterized protein YabE (DUF348 family)